MFSESAHHPLHTLAYLAPFDESRRSGSPVNNVCLNDIVDKQISWNIHLLYLIDQLALLLNDSALHQGEIMYKWAMSDVRVSLWDH